MKKNSNWLTVCLEEYKMVRTECLTAIKTQNSTLTFGALVIGILAAAAANLWSKDELGLLVAGVIFWICIPLVCLLITLIWAGEVIRLLRAHGFAISIENRINDNVKETTRALQYGCWLETVHENKIIPRVEWNYWAVIGLFMFIALLSCFSGFFIVKSQVCIQFLWLVWLGSALLVIALIICACFGFAEYKKKNQFLRTMMKDCQQHLTP